MSSEADTRQVAARRAVLRSLRPLVHYGLLPIVMVLLALTFGSLEARYYSLHNIINVLEQSSFLIVMAVAQMFALLTRGFDLSVGQTISMISVAVSLVMVGLAGDGGQAAVFAVVIGLLAGLALGLAVGAVNGACIAFLGVHPFIVTLGMQGVALGVATTISGGFPVFEVPGLLNETFNQARWLGVPAPIALAIIVCAGVAAVLKWTVFGRAVYLIGGNPRAAAVAGINRRLHLVGAYVACSFITAIAALMLTARTGSGEPMLGGGLMLQCIAAAVIGGVSLRGGEGHVMHCVLGAVFVTMLSNGMNLVRVDGYTQMIVLGIVVVAGVFIDRLRVYLR